MERSDRHPTEEPTARRLARARRHGQVAVSTDLSAAWGLVALLASLLAFGPAAWSLLLSLFRRSLAASVATGAVDVAAVAGEGIARGTKHLAAAGVDAGWTAGVVAVVPLAGVSAAVLLAGVAQTGGLVAWRAAASSRGGLFSGAGLQRVLGVGPWMDAGKVAIEIGVVLVAAIASLAPHAGRLPWLGGAPPASVLAAAAALGQRVGVAVTLALVAWGTFDWLWARQRDRRSLMMTRDEARREDREAEGDPAQRAERWRRHRAMGAQPIATGVRRARVVVVDRDQISVAVAYAPETGLAPTVVASAAGPSATGWINQIAIGAGVAIHGDPAMAQALRAVAVGDEIPEALHESVAEMFATIEGGDGAARAGEVT